MLHVTTWSLTSLVLTGRCTFVMLTDLLRTYVLVQYEVITSSSAEFSCVMTKHIPGVAEEYLYSITLIPHSLLRHR